MSRLARPWLPAVIVLLASVVLPATAIASGAIDVVDPDEGSGGTSWGPIVGACLGVAFGGALALWQIRGMKNRD